MFHPSYEASKTIPIQYFESLFIDINNVELIGSRYCSESVFKYNDIVIKRFDIYYLHAYISEIAILRRCNHPNIINIINIQTSPEFIQMAFPLAKSDCVNMIISYEQQMQLLRAVSYLHAKNIAHRDIKPDNVLIMSDDSIRLCDFGLSIDNYDDHTNSVGTLWYQAPEILLRDITYSIDYHMLADVWALGCTLYEVTTGTVLFKGSYDTNQAYEIFRYFEYKIDDTSSYWKSLSKWDDLESMLGRMRPNNRINDLDSYPLVKDCLIMNPHNRPKSSNLVCKYDSLSVNGTFGPEKRIRYPNVENSKSRVVVMEWMLDECLSKNLPKRCHSLAMYIYDSIASAPTSKVKVLAMACLKIACDYVVQNTYQIPSYEYFVELSNGSITVHEIKESVLQICIKCEYDFQITTCYDILKEMVINAFDFNRLWCLMSFINCHDPPTNPLERVADIISGNLQSFKNNHPGIEIVFNTFINDYKDWIESYVTDADMLKRFFNIRVEN